MKAIFRLFFIFVLSFSFVEGVRSAPADKQLSSPVTILDGTATVRMPTGFVRIPEPTQSKELWFYSSGGEEATITFALPLPGMKLNDTQLKEFTAGVREQVEEMRVAGQSKPTVKTLIVNKREVNRMESIIQGDRGPAKVIMQSALVNGQLLLIVINVPVKLPAEYLAAGKASLDTLTW